MDDRPVAAVRRHPNSVVRLRGRAGLSIRELAAAAGINEKTLRWIEVGRIPLRTPTAHLLASALGCPAEKLMEPCRSPRNAHIRTRRKLRNLKRGRGAKRWAGKLPIPPSAHPLVRQMFEAMNARKLLISDVAEISGVSKHTISDWRYKRTPGVENLNAALNVLNLELTIAEMDDDTG
jgi:transcriptional regulator with XRE-family HTH domain